MKYVYGRRERERERERERGRGRERERERERGTEHKPYRKNFREISINDKASSFKEASS